MSKPFYRLDYRTIITEAISRKVAPKDFEAELALRGHFPVSFLAGVLSGFADFTPDQGFLISRVLDLDSLQTAYFMMSIQHSRANTREYKVYLEEQMEMIRMMGDLGAPPPKPRERGGFIVQNEAYEFTTQGRRIKELES